MRWLASVVLLACAACTEDEASAVLDAGAATVDAADETVEAGDATVEAGDATVDAGDAAIAEANGCAIDLGAEPTDAGRELECRAETRLPIDDSPGFITFFAAQGDRSVRVYWAHADFSVGATVELPHIDSNRAVTIDYFAPGAEGSERASEGTVRIVAATDTYFEVELIDVRFASLPDFELNGFIGADLSPFVCLIC